MPRQKINVNEIEVTQIKSTIGRPKKHELILKALGLGRIGKKVVHNDTPDVRGMVNKVIHLIDVKDIKAKIKSGEKS